MKILIAVPTFESIFPDTYQSIFDMDKGGHEIRFEFVRGYDCATARTTIAQKAISKGADYVLMVDNDVVLPQDALTNLLDDAKDVCLGFYAHRDGDNIYRGRTCVCKLGPFNYSLDSEYTDKELRELYMRGERKVQIHGGGMGCALIKTEVFQRIKYPWYDWVNYQDSNRGMLSEDLYFCEQCRKAEIPIYTDTRVGCGHILRHIQWPECGQISEEGMYKVIEMFEDLMDTIPVKGGRLPYRYEKGDIYPRPGAKPSMARIVELSGSNNLRGKPLIEPIVAPVSPAVASKGEKAEKTAPLPKKRRKKAVEGE